MIQFGNGSFSFGPLSGVTQGLYETNHDIAFQRFLDWSGQNNVNFGGTTAGRYLQQQQGAWNNRFLTQQAQQAERLAAARQQYDALMGRYQDLSGQVQSWGIDNGDVANPNTDPRYQGLLQQRLDLWRQLQAYGGSQYRAPEEPLTWTKFLEQNQGDITGGFNQLTAAMRGANPGAFQIRRNLW